MTAGRSEPRQAPVADGFRHDVRFRGSHGAAGITAYCEPCEWRIWIDDGHTAADLAELVRQHSGDTERLFRLRADDWTAISAALAGAAHYHRDRAGCQACEDSLSGACDSCIAELDAADMYDQVAARIGGDR